MNKAWPRVMTQEGTARAVPSSPQASTSLHLKVIPRVEYHTLWCLLLGGRRPFKVTLPLNVDTDVDDLRELIHVKGINITKSTILAKDLILWKLNESESLEPNDTFFDRISVKISNLSKIATELGPSQKLSVVLSQQHAQDTLHVIVQMPPDTQRRTGLWEIRKLEVLVLASAD
ncbi:hypothetical protein APHAL10511_001272 [Amanita phalloides]|nr:hypothetical protein APHAL10511_001272 [Amanita phalloides]